MCFLFEHHVASIKNVYIQQLLTNSGLIHDIKTGVNYVQARTQTDCQRQGPIMSSHVFSHWDLLSTTWDNVYIQQLLTISWFIPSIKTCFNDVQTRTQTDCQRQGPIMSSHVFSHWDLLSTTWDLWSTTCKRTRRPTANDRDL